MAFRLGHLIKLMLRFGKSAIVLGIGFGLALLSLAMAQTTFESPAVKTAADRGIEAALRQVSGKQIQANVERLVSFGTRSTISLQDPASISAGHGIGAAREWIKSEFERYSKDCGGCLEVKTDTFTEPKADRIPQPTEITNV